MSINFKTLCGVAKKVREKVPLPVIAVAVAALILTAVLLTDIKLNDAAVQEQPQVQEEPKAQEEPVKEPEQPKDEPESKPKEEPKAVTDPNGCEPEQYWAKESPYYCIDKVVESTKPATSAASTPVETPPKPATPAPAPVTSGGAITNCTQLRARLAAVGVSSADIPAAINIATRESGCRSNAVNPSSGACNVFQEYTCGKWGGTGNVDAHIRGADSYAKSVYGGWWGAWSAWQSKHWW